TAARGASVRGPFPRASRACAPVKSQGRGWPCRAAWTNRALSLSRRAMLRRLVTLLAFLSGLAAIRAPGRARAAEGPGVAASAELRADCVRKASRTAERRPATEKGTTRQLCRKPAPSIVYFPPVMLKADRARE